MSKILSCNERRKLIKCHRNERDGHIRGRIKAVLAYDYGYSEIAKILLLDDEIYPYTASLDYNRATLLQPISLSIDVANNHSGKPVELRLAIKISNAGKYMGMFPITQEKCTNGDTNAQVMGGQYFKA